MTLVRLGENTSGPDANCCGAINGAWHWDLNQQLQADWYDQFLTLCLSHPGVRSVTFVTLFDTNPNWMASGGLCHADGTPKPVYERIVSLFERHTDRAAQADWKTSLTQPIAR